MVQHNRIGAPVTIRDRNCSRSLSEVTRLNWQPEAFFLLMQ